MGVAEGSAVRVGGRFKEAADNEQRVFTTTDGGNIVVASDNSELSSPVSGFVEIVGTKSSDTELSLAGVVPLGDDVDVVMWDEAVKMSHLPQLRSMFAPVV